jgi:4-hydroxy-3-polyprenylbenzoate decarboxylase
MAQATLKNWIDTLDKAGLLRRYTDEKRVDELPQLMEANPDQAIFVEHVRDCPFPFLANGYSSRAMWGLALDCDPKQVALEVSRRTGLQRKAELVNTAPCKDVILKGKDVDLTLFPLFQHHPRDGHAYLNDTRIVSHNPDSGLINDGIQRLMYRSPTMTNVDMRARRHHGSINASRYHELGKDMPIAVCIGGPTLDMIASMMSSPGVDKWDMLGGFRGEPARIVKCETNDLTVPVNAEIVLEGRVITSEDEIHDEGPYGELMGSYGPGLPHNWAVVIDCITYRRGAIYQHSTIGGLHPGRTDNYAFQPTIEGDLHVALQTSGLLVQNVHLPPGGGGNIAYASIKTRGGGDAKQALALILAGSRQWMPKVAYVFDDDIDIYNDERVKWAQAWRYDPETGTVIMPGQNALMDPSLVELPVHMTKIGFDCTIPLVGHVDRWGYDAATVTEPIAQPPNPRPLSEDELTQEMEKFIREKPRTWLEVLENFAGQPYPVVYRSFGRLRPKLGRVADDNPAFPYTFSDSDFVYLNAKSKAATSQ